MIKVGTVYQHEFSFSQTQVDAFAEITGDNNPIHIDKTYAENSIYKRRIIHGFLTGSVFSKVFGTLFPGEGTIYLNQNMTFLRPMYADEKYIATFEILEKDQVKKRAKVKTTITNELDKVTLRGDALIQNIDKL